MASTVKENHYAGGAALAAADREGQKLATQIRDLIDDVTGLRTAYAALRTQYTALLVKLDADGGVTDTNYAATLPISALATQACTKG
jgi:hypothetical protein